MREKNGDRFANIKHGRQILCNMQDWLLTLPKAIFVNIIQHSSCQAPSNLSAQAYWATPEDGIILGKKM